MKTGTNSKIFIPKITSVSRNMKSRPTILIFVIQIGFE